MHSNAIEAAKQKLRLTTEQREILIGTLLGDGTLETQNAGRTYRLKIEQSLRHQAYVQHLYQLFRDWVLSPPKERQKTHQRGTAQSLAFATVSHPAFRFYAHQFYCDGRKQVPKLIHRWLTPRAIAYWYMDDGSIKSKESKGMILNTQGFLRIDVERLCQVLARHHAIDCVPRKQREGCQIYISGHSYESMQALIGPYLIESMRYKFPQPRRT